MGDPNGKWDDLDWTARKLWSEGISLIPLDGKGKPLVNWRKYLKDDTSRLPLSELLASIKDGAEGCWSGLDTSKARKILGYTDRYIWEDHIRPDGTLISK